MRIFNFSIKNKHTILALGAESAGNFSVFQNGRIFYFDNFGDLLEEKNFSKFKKEVLTFIKKNKINPDTVITDLHPGYITTTLGEELTKKFKATHIKVQHHHAHIFSAIGNNIVSTKSQKLKTKNYGIALDGTGYGTDEKIWGGEVFKLKSEKLKVKSLERIGRLENQILLGGELAIREPARLLISILAKIPNCKSTIANKLQNSKIKNCLSIDKSQKEFVYNFVKKYYSKNEFELLWNQLQQNFNCIETSSTGRVFDAVSILLGFSTNERKYKHEPTYLLEENSTLPYNDLKSQIIKVTNKNDLLKNLALKIDSKFEIQNSKFILDTTYLFTYLLKYLPGNMDGNVPRDKKRLAATAQFYIAQGLHEIIKKHNNHPLPLLKGEMSEGQRGLEIILSGGLSENRIIKNYFISQKLIPQEKPLIPRGDNGISFGQIIWLLLQK